MMGIKVTRIVAFGEIPKSLFIQHSITKQCNVADHDFSISQAFKNKVSFPSIDPIINLAYHPAYYFRLSPQLVLFIQLIHSSLFSTLLLATATL